MYIQHRTFLVGPVLGGGSPLRGAGGLLGLEFCLEFGDAHRLVHLEVRRVPVQLCLNENAGVKRGG